VNTAGTATVPNRAVAQEAGSGSQSRPAPRRLSWGARGIALGSGVLFALAFPPLPLAGLAFVCLAPIAAFIARWADDGDRAGISARLGAWFALAAFGLSLYWIGVALSLFTSLSWLAYVATIVGMSLLVAATTSTLHIARRITHWPMAVLLPATWVTLEIFLAYFSDLAFPWFPLGLAVATHPALAQAADVSGVHGLSVWIAATNGLLADAWLLWRRGGDASPTLRRAVRPVALAAALCAAVWAYGMWRLRTVTLEPLARVGIVQPDIPEDEKMQQEMRGRFIEPLAALTRQEEATGPPPQLVLWPETALPDFLINHPAWSDSLRSLARTGHAPILFGLIDYTVTGPGPSDFEFYNAATVVDTSGRIGAEPAYHKVYLVPIVERVPFLNPRWFAGGKHFQALLHYFGGFGRGTSAIPFTFAFGKVGVLICYESIFPQQSRAFRRAGADLIVNITNDAWFGRSLAPYQHEAHLHLRAIENRVGIVRAANTGISEYIDPLGRSHGATGLFVSATRIYDAQTTSIRPLAVRWGDWIGTACVLFAAGVLVLRFVARRRYTPA
jgi:apolipoprotein N-acyltransferase